MAGYLVRVLSLGAGVQSTTLLRMSIRGELPKLDYAIFADTGWEPRRVYEHLDRLEYEAEAAGIPLIRLTGRDIRQDALKSQVGANKASGMRWASMPYYTRLPGRKREGRIKRQCSAEYKWQRIEQWIRRNILHLKPYQKSPRYAVIEHWLGISTDEPRRLRPLRNPWEIVRYPLVQDLDMSREDCLAWHREHGYPRPPRSACVGCPNHSDDEWREMARISPDEYREAVEFDRSIRKLGGMLGDTYLHRSCRPIDEALGIPADNTRASTRRERTPAQPARRPEAL